MSRFTNALKLALESDGDEVIGVDADVIPEAEVVGEAEEGEMSVVSQDDDVIVDTSDSAEEAVADSDEAEAVYEDEEAKADEIEEAAAGLESIYETLRSAGKSKPLTQETLRFANLAIESYGNRIGKSDSMTLSTEGRGNTISLEGIKETLKAAWDFMVKQVKRIWNAIINFLKRVYSIAERVKQRGQKLARFEIKGAPKNATIDIKGLAKSLAVGAEVKTDAKAGLAEIDDLASGSIAISGFIANQHKSLAGDLQAFVSGKLDTAGLLEAGATAAGKLEKFFKTDTGATLTGNVEVKVYVKEFFGKKFKFTRLANVEAAVPKKTEVKTLEMRDIRAVGAAAVTTAELVIKAKAATDAAERSVNATLKGLNVTKELNAEERKAFNNVIALIRFENSIMGAGSAKVLSHAMKTALAYVKLAEKSAAEYGGKAAKPAKEAKAA